jgi:glyoxylase-like metal-dependent hydrolase (beta-lactamase superfamily II)
MIQEIFPEIYDITVDEENGRRYRVYFDTRGVPTLIDTGFEDSTDTLFDAIEELGTDPERLIITHGDPDHVGGFDAVVDRYGVETWVPEQTDLAGTEEPDIRYSGGDTIGPFEAVFAPGHEPDNHALVDEAAGFIVPGDALFGADLRGFPDGYLLPPPALYSEHLNRAEESIERLLEFEFDAVLVFHGSAVLEGAHERLDAFINFPGRPAEATYL